MGDPGVQPERDSAISRSSDSGVVWTSAALPIAVRRALASADDVETILRSIARCVVPAFADASAIDIIDQDGSLLRVTGEEAGGRTSLLPDIERQEVARLATRSGLPLLSAEGADLPLPALLPIDPSSETLLARPRVVLSVPLIARGRTIGAFTVSRSADRPFRSDDLAVAEDLGLHIALVVESARLEVLAQAESARREHAEAREQAAGRAAEVALRVRDEFLASMTHDLRTPLTTIKGRTQILRRQVARSQDPSADDMLYSIDAIESAVRRLTGLVGELVDLTRLESGRGLRLDRTLTDLIALAREVVADYRRATTRHVVRLEGSDEAIIGLWDGARLSRVLDNLLANALRYSLDGGEIVVSIARDGENGAVVSVRDEGIGIPMADLPYIFERFRRGANVTDRIAGAGIGLAGAKTLVELHGGSIAVDSEEGAGTTVTVRLPIDIG